MIIYETRSKIKKYCIVVMIMNIVAWLCMAVVEIVALMHIFREVL